MSYSSASSGRTSRIWPRVMFGDRASGSSAAGRAAGSPRRARVLGEELLRRSGRSLEAGQVLRLLELRLGEAAEVAVGS